MKRVLKKITVSCAVLVMSISLTVGVAHASSLSQLFETGMSYADTVEQVIAGLVPEDGITIRNRTYGYWDVITFLDEVRWCSDYYVHKDHHCALAELPQEEVEWIVKALRLLMNCE